MALRLVAEEIGIGLAIGLVLTTGAVWLLRLCKRRDWVSHTWLQIPVVALAFACFATAQALGGSSFIASFVDGVDEGQTSQALATVPRRAQGRPINSRAVCERRLQGSCSKSDQTRLSYSAPVFAGTATINTQLQSAGIGTADAPANRQGRWLAG